MNGEDLKRLEEKIKHIKRSFHTLCLMHQFMDSDFQELAALACVERAIVDDMFKKVAVRQEDAKKVLSALSTHVGGSWSLDHVKVALLPTFAELHAEHQFDLATLAAKAGVPYATLDMMLSGHPVSEQDARLVLQMASRLANEHYTLKTVDVPLTREEEAQ